VNDLGTEDGFDPPYPGILAYIHAAKSSSALGAEVVFEVAAVFVGFFV